jgi:hypothetical protein
MSRALISVRVLVHNDPSSWVDATLRWDPSEALEEMEMFRGDHGLVIDVCAVQERRKSVAMRRPPPPPRGMTDNAEAEKPTTVAHSSASELQVGGATSSTRI